jgi:threonylcarbamoyladenosine tRNA methylthiotransferase MtaB
MVGFPGEGREEFVNTKKLLADLPISYFHVFTYSDREGTSSIKMSDKVDYHDKKERNRILSEQGKRKKITFYEQYIGQEQLVLFEQRNKSGNWSGYTSNYMSVEVQSDQDLHNLVRKVKFNKLNDNFIKAKLLEL